MDPLKSGLVRGAIVVLALLPVAHSARATVTAIPVARDGNAAPGGNGTFWDYLTYGEPCVNDAGQVAFTARLISTSGGSADNDILVRGEPGGTLTKMAREGQPIPDGPGLFGGLQGIIRQYAMNDSGRIAITAPLTGTPGGSTDNLALYSAITPGLWWRHVRRGDIAPFTTSPFNGIFPPQINDQPPAAVAFLASLGTSSIPGVVYIHRLGLLSPVSWITQSAPDASEGDGVNGSVFAYPGEGPPALRRNAAEIAIWAHMSGTTLASQDDDGIFRASADGFWDMARGHQAAPGGGTYGEMNSPAYNRDGIAAFRSRLYPVPGAGEIIALDWPFGGQLCAFTGQSTADGNGTISGLYEPAVNGAETVAFKANLGGTTAGSLDDVAIYKCDSPYTAVPAADDQLAREGQAPPEGNGVFADFANIVQINEAGQVLFIATLRSTAGGSSDDRGLYLWDPTEGLVKVMREGDVIDGRTVLAFSTLTERDFGGYRVLSDAGDAVARVDMSGFGGDGIYRFHYAGAAVSVALPQREAELALAIAPNPVGDGPVALRYTLPAAGAMLATAHDVTGRLVRTLHDGPSEATGTLAWNGADADGHAVPAGMYFVRISIAGHALTRRLVRVR